MKPDIEQIVIAVPDGQRCAIIKTIYKGGSADTPERVELSEPHATATALLARVADHFGAKNQ